MCNDNKLFINFRIFFIRGLSVPKELQVTWLVTWLILVYFYNSDEVSPGGRGESFRWVSTPGKFDMSSHAQLGPTLSKPEQGVRAPENNVKAPSQPQIPGASQCPGLLF